MPDAPAETPFVTVLVTPSHPDLDEHQLVRLARELAHNIQAPEDVLASFNITTAQYEKYIFPNEFFKRALETLIIEWNAALSTPQRLKLKSAAILEDSLPHLGARMNDKREALPAVVQAVQAFAKIAGIGEEQRQGAPGEKFTITINLGADEQKIDVTPAPTQMDNEPTVRQITQGGSTPPASQLVTKGTPNTPTVQPITEGAPVKTPT